MANANDLFLVLGLCLILLALPSLIGAWIEDRVSRLGAILCLLGVVLAAIALSRHPGGYSLGDLPDVIRRVVTSLTP